MAFPFAETVTVTRQTRNSVGDLTPGAAHAVAGCAVWPTTGAETVNGGQDILIFGLAVLMPAQSDILSTDQVTVRGIAYQVDGEPVLYFSPLTGFSSGIEVHLKAALG